jgi:drug efflux transport system permease protein
MRNPFQWGRAASIARKEVRHIIRDPFTLGLAIGLPLLMVLFFGYAMDFNVHDIDLTVYDQDHSRASRELAEAFQSSGYFNLHYRSLDPNPAATLDSQAAKGALFIEPHFARDIVREGTATAQVLIDGSDNSTAGVIGGYLTGIQQAAAQRITGSPQVQPLRLDTRYLFNGELNSRWFTVPGLSVVVLAIISIMLTALTVAREWENGSMEMLLSTPVSPLEIIVGKLAPYLAMGFIAQGIIYLAARLLFGVPFAGSHFLLFTGTLLFLAASLAQGLIISVTTRHQIAAIQFSQMAGQLPSLLLSGFIFPIESMSAFFRYFTMIFPARWFMVVMRGLFLRGAGWGELAGPLGVLLLMDAIFISLAVRLFKKDVEP